MKITIKRQQSDSREFNNFQDQLIQALFPLTNNPVLMGVILENVELSAGDNTINTKINRKLIGWYIVRKRAASEIYDKQDTNSSPDKTLILNSQNDCTVDLYVF